MPTFKQLAWLCHWIFVEIRQFTFQPGHERLVNDLADLAELIPLQFISRHERYLDIIVKGCHDLERKHPELNGKLTRIFEKGDEEIMTSLMPPDGPSWSELKT